MERKTELIRSDWTIGEVKDIFHLPLLELIHIASMIHRANHDPQEIQINQLISIKTGACPEDCAYCSQSISNNSGIKPEPLMATEEVVSIAKRAIEHGVTRVCLGAAWREVRDSIQFEKVIETVRQVNKLGVEVCCTLGMLNSGQAVRLEEAGLYAYNHNLDTSESFYRSIVTTRTYQDRIDTIACLRETSITVCCGGIIGMGESESDRIDLLHRLATLEPHPESVPINVLSKVAGTPLENEPDVPVDQVIRMIACARILMPASIVRIAAGRHLMSVSDQALCFMAGANSIFSSENEMMLTESVPCASHSEDEQMLNRLGLKARQLGVDATRS